MSEKRCELCRADFREDSMVESPAGVPKCRPCALEHPDARTREEIQVNTPNKAQTMTEETVRAMIYEVLEEANLKRHKCEKCGAKFYRSKPMQVKCPACLKNEEAAKKETN